MRTILLIILGVVLIMVFWRLFRTRSTGRGRGDEPAPAPRSLADLHVRDASVGDTISIHGAGADFEDLDFTVDRRNRYESGEETWFELSGVHRGRRLFLEVYEDDVVEVSYSWADESRTLPEIGLTEDDLVRLDEEGRAGNTVEALGETWRYEESGEVGYFREGEGEGEGFYSWSLRSADGQRVLFIEKYEGEPFEAGVATAVMMNAAAMRARDRIFMAGSGTARVEGDG